MTMQEKIDADTARLEFNAEVASTLARLRNRAQSLESLCKDEVDDHGVFAKVFADVMAERFNEIAKEADKLVWILANAKV